ncbi:MAG: hypothetical protein ACLRZZ_17965 [Enterocloster sp.]
MQAVEVEEIKETVEVEAGITLNASRTEYVSGSGARESSQPEAVPQTPEADASAQQPDTPAVQTGTEAAGSVTAGVKPGVRSRQGNDGSFRSGSGNRGTACCACCGTHCGGARRGNDG